MKHKIDSVREATDVLDGIKVSIRNDIGPIIKYYYDTSIKTKTGIGFFAVLRCIFPEIDCLGSYYCGEINNTARNATEYIREYFGKVNPEYQKKGAFIYQVYRHGLMHQHSPALLFINGKTTGWSISISYPLNKPDGHLAYDNQTHAVSIDVHQFYDDLLKSIDFFRLDISHDNEKLKMKFFKAHEQMHKPVMKEKLLSKPYITEKDFLFIDEK